ncbi:MAG TPA: hypothetical protein VHY84_03385 [Bryobacteraceae bacterium]|jgi:hypothetical protein|nr:hypothetical protein [Bryobacteraceae bacterium]
MKQREALKQTAAESADEAAEVERILEYVQESLSDDRVMPSLTDLVRLFGLRRELAQSQPGSLTAGWIDGCQPTTYGEE